MSKERFAEEFKQEAVRQVIERGYTVVDVGKRLGITGVRSQFLLILVKTAIWPRLSRNPRLDCFYTWSTVTHQNACIGILKQGVGEFRFNCTIMSNPNRSIRYILNNFSHIHSVSKTGFACCFYLYWDLYLWYMSILAITVIWPRLFCGSIEYGGGNQWKKIKQGFANAYFDLNNYFGEAVLAFNMDGGR